MEDIIKGTRFYSDNINLGPWISETMQFKGDNGTIFETFERIGFIFKISDQHSILAEIRNKSRSHSTCYTHRVSIGTNSNEIVVYDSN